jgi:2-polyprenyl-3-methyl-5-hydroxy-6-metoxy-1,4-benzoquinol methylase
VTVLDVLKHQSDDREFMRTVVEKMNPGAVLLVTVPALHWLWSRWDSALGHFRRYHRDDLMACLDGLPLSVDETTF